MNKKAMQRIMRRHKLIKQIRRIGATYHRTTSDNASSRSSLKYMDRVQREGLYVKGKGYLKADLDKGVNMDLFVMEPPANRPYDHLLFNVQYDKLLRINKLN
jgi:hypothetical protein